MKKEYFTKAKIVYTWVVYNDEYEDVQTYLVKANSASEALKQWLNYANDQKISVFRPYVRDVPIDCNQDIIRL